MRIAHVHVAGCGLPSHNGDDGRELSRGFRRLHLECAGVPSAHQSGHLWNGKGSGGQLSEAWDTLQAGKLPRVDHMQHDQHFLGTPPAASLLSFRHVLSCCWKSGVTLAVISLCVAWCIQPHHHAHMLAIALFCHYISVQSLLSAMLWTGLAASKPMS